jgi:hypothetical protein
VPGGLDDSTAASVVARFGDRTLVSSFSGTVFTRGDADETHQLAGMFEAGEVADFTDPGDGVEESDPAQTHERLDQGKTAPRLDLLFDDPSQSLHPLGGVLRRIEPFLEGDLLAWEVKLLPAEIIQMLRGPGGFAGVTTALTQEESLDALAAATEIFHGTEAGADQITDGFIGLLGNVDEGQFTGAQESGQGQGVATIGLDAVARPLGQERLGNDLAGDLEAVEMARQPETGRTRLIDIADLHSAFGEFLVQFVDRMGMSGDIAIGA